MQSEDAESLQILDCENGGPPRRPSSPLFGSPAIRASDFSYPRNVGSSATLGTGSAFQGTLLAYASITLTGGSSVVGRALALNAAVTLDNNYVVLSN